MDTWNRSEPERRRYARTRASVQLELRPEGSNAPLRVETTDISVIGCYIEMTITLEVGRKVAVGLWLGEQKVTTEGLIVTHHPQFGNGIEFVGMSKQNQSKLKQHLDSVSR